MLRKFVLAAVAAASLGVGLAAAATPASAEHWGGPRYGYGGYDRGHDRGYGPPPWVVRKWFSHRHHHGFGPPAYSGWRERHFGRPAYSGWRERRFEGHPGSYRPRW